MTVRLACFGDSITAGVYLRPEETFVHELGRRFGLDTVNAGVPGNTTGQALERMQADVLDRKPDICVLQFGMNDHCAIAPDRPKVELDVFTANLQRMLERLGEIGTIPVLCTVHPILVGTPTSYYYGRHPQEWYRTPLGAKAWIECYNEAIRTLAGKRKVRLADVSARWRHEVSRGVPLTDLLRTRENSGVDDGVHPTPLGMRLYADSIGEEVKQVMRGLSGRPV